MKRLFLPLLLASLPAWVNAEAPLETRLSSQIQTATTHFGTVSEAEKKLIIRNVASTLSKHVAFRSDGTESSSYEAPEGRQFVEWMDLRIHKLATAPLSQADKDRGVTKRIQAHLAYDNCRTRDFKANNWDAWGAQSHPLFPLVITFDWVSGRLVVDTGMHLNKFKPGSMATGAGSVNQVAANTPASMPASTPATTGRATHNQAPTQGTILKAPASSMGLPSGMTRQ